MDQLHSLPIVPGRGLGGLTVSQPLPPGEWEQLRDDNFPFDFWWPNEIGAEVEILTRGDHSILVFLDGSGTVRWIWATPNYTGALPSGVCTRMTGAQAIGLQPGLRFDSMNGALHDPAQPGFALQHAELDLDFEDMLREPLDFISVHDPERGYFQPGPDLPTIRRASRRDQQPNPLWSTLKSWWGA